MFGGWTFDQELPTVAGPESRSGGERGAGVVVAVAVAAGCSLPGWVSPGMTPCPEPWPFL